MNVEGKVQSEKSSKEEDGHWTKKIELETYYMKRWFLTHHRSLFEKRGKRIK
jgi:hypothetical protein